MKKTIHYKYRCRDCGFEFDEPESKEVDAEDFYGVGGMFDDHHSITLDACPNCYSEEIEEN